MEEVRQTGSYLAASTVTRHKASVLGSTCSCQSVQEP
jgi:hypothetical protein